MTDIAKIDALIDSLAHTQTAADAFNEYACGNANENNYKVNNAIRRQNLRLYLRHMLRLQAKAMLVMEAPGYRGCRLTGIPVTSRKIMLEGLPGLDLFGGAAGYRDVDDAGFEDIYGEQSATIVWKTLADLGALPLIWNAYPFNPRKPGQARSNRKPRRGELDVGAAFLRAALALCPVQQVIAVGNVAYDTLGKIGVTCDKVRHPAHGGKNEFVAGLGRLLGR